MERNNGWGGTYDGCKGGPGAETADCDKNVPGLANGGYDLTACDVGVGLVVKKGREEFKSCVERVGGLDALGNMILEKGSEDIGVIGRKGGSKDLVGEFCKGVVTRGKDCDVLL